MLQSAEPLPETYWRALIDRHGGGSKLDKERKAITRFIRERLWWHVGGERELGELNAFIDAAEPE